MRILILSANTGEGHNSAARALEEYIKAKGGFCRVTDGLNYMAPSRNKLICRSHVFFYRRLPKVYGMGYRFEERQARRQRYQQKLVSPAARRKKLLLSRHRRALMRLLNSGEYDAVICVHVFAARLVSLLRASGRARIPAFFLATDYTCSPGVNQLDMDAWFIPHPKLLHEFEAYGIPREKLIPTGIPVRRAYFEPRSKVEARRALNLPENRPVVLLSCGSMGAGNMEEMVNALLKSLPENALLAVICGSNQSLETQLRSFAPQDRLLTLGFTDRMRDYMAAADIFITKPGGLSTTEAALSQTPLLLINAVPGLETRNLEFLTELGCALQAADADELAYLAAQALEAPEQLETLRAGCRREFNLDGAREIYDVLERFCCTDAQRAREI